MIRGFKELPSFLDSGPTKGFFADTSVLFSFSYPLDSFNEYAEDALNPLYRNKLPIFTNVMVRVEFLELYRRVLIPECLIDFYQDFGNYLPGPIAIKLQAHRTSYRRKLAEEKSAKLDTNQIKIFRSLLNQLSGHDGEGWELFCRGYLDGKMASLWDTITKRLNVEFISLRSSDQSVHLDSAPNWENAVSLMGRYGVASSDAMILNMFLCSNIPALLTADLEMAHVAAKESKGKKSIFVPDALLST